LDDEALATFEVNGVQCVKIKWLDELKFETHSKPEDAFESILFSAATLHALENAEKLNAKRSAILNAFTKKNKDSIRCWGSWSLSAWCCSAASAPPYFLALLPLHPLPALSHERPEGYLVVCAVGPVLAPERAVRLLLRHEPHDGLVGNGPNQVVGPDKGHRVGVHVVALEELEDVCTAGGWGGLEGGQHGAGAGWGGRVACEGVHELGRREHEYHTGGRARGRAGRQAGRQVSHLQAWQCQAS
jgi:hypothetical protein